LTGKRRSFLRMVARLSSLPVPRVLAVGSLLMFLCAMRRRSMGKTLRQRFFQRFLLHLLVILFRFCLARRRLLAWMGRCLRVCVRRAFLAGISVWLGA